MAWGHGAPPSAPSTSDLPALFWGFGTSLQPPPPPSRWQGSGTPNDCQIKDGRSNINMVNLRMRVILTPAVQQLCFWKDDSSFVNCRMFPARCLFFAVDEPLSLLHPARLCSALHLFLCECTSSHTSKPQWSLLICWNFSKYFSITLRWEGAVQHPWSSWLSEAFAGQNTELSRREFWWKQQCR